MASKRQANFELLRMVAILMVIGSHYIVKGNITSYDGSGWTPIYSVLQLFKAFVVPSLNCYVLLSGYFMVEAKWKPQRILSLLMQILFYSVLIPFILIGTGVIAWSDLNAYDWIGFILPISTEHYWFATAYLYLFLFAPILAAGVRKMEKKTLQTVIVLLLLFFSVEKSIVPVALVMDKGGYDFGWLLCLFLIAAYIRLYGIEWLDRKGHGIKLYVLMCLCAFALSAISGMVVAKTGKLSYYEEEPYTLNHICILLASVGLFMAFKNMQIPEGKTAEIIRHLAPYTLGVYLLHEHILVRYEWMKWLQIDKVRDSWLFIPHMVLCILIVYAAGALTDFVRTYLFEVIGKKWKK
ncbi:MAG: acyltransferase [Bacillus sp. (in: Bacteria)]|nr:acyltransferase [Bacillus sp. (in: firmicutes)]MCM1425435.1 acyltransferase [Eubacterium sp.]